MVTPTEAWKYNGKGEVVDANHSDDNKDRDYTYDGIGNRTAATQGLPGVAPVGIAYAPNALNQYNTVGAIGQVHDLDGNLTDDGTRRYIWDAENRLIAVYDNNGTPALTTDDNLISEYRYDYMSRRVYKETTSIAAQQVTTTLFHYDGWNLCAEYTASAIGVDGLGATIPAAITALKRTYTWGSDLSGSRQGAGGVGGLLAIEEKSGTHVGKYYPLYDGNGNVTELVKAGGTTGTTLVAHYEYDPFGNTTQDDNKDGTAYNAVNRYKFSTKYHDEETGLYYYGYRYYDSLTGRWVSRDPIGELGGNNLFCFVYNSPPILYDPDGRTPSSSGSRHVDPTELDIPFHRNRFSIQKVVGDVRIYWTAYKCKCPTGSLCGITTWTEYEIPHISIQTGPKSRATIKHLSGWRKKSPSGPSPGGITRMGQNMVWNPGVDCKVLGADCKASNSSDEEDGTLLLNNPKKNKGVRIPGATKAPGAADIPPGNADTPLPLPEQEAASDLT